jgi:putative PIN family toxin of toxin-antitoxin system
MVRKIILDVNIWISIFLKKKMNYFLDIVVHQNLEFISDENLRNELIDVISRKKFSSTFSVEDIVDAIDFFDAISTFVPTEKKFLGSPDIKDDYLFDLANQSETKIIVTGDKKLLDFKTENISLITFSEFLQEFK